MSYDIMFSVEYTRTKEEQDYYLKELMENYDVDTLTELEHDDALGYIPSEIEYTCSESRNMTYNYSKVLAMTGIGPFSAKTKEGMTELEFLQILADFERGLELVKEDKTLFTIPDFVTSFVEDDTTRVTEIKKEMEEGGLDIRNTLSLYPDNGWGTKEQLIPQLETLIEDIKYVLACGKSYKQNGREVSYNFEVN